MSGAKCRLFSTPEFHRIISSCYDNLVSFIVLLSMMVWFCFWILCQVQGKNLTDDAVALLRVDADKRVSMVVELFFQGDNDTLEVDLGLFLNKGSHLEQEKSFGI
jgi:hypothetical protein